MSNATDPTLRGNLPALTNEHRELNPLTPRWEAKLPPVARARSGGDIPLPVRARVAELYIEALDLADRTSSLLGAWRDLEQTIWTLHGYADDSFCDLAKQVGTAAVFDILHAISDGITNATGCMADGAADEEIVPADHWPESSYPLDLGHRAVALTGRRRR